MAFFRDLNVVSKSAVEVTVVVRDGSLRTTITLPAPACSSCLRMSGSPSTARAADARRTTRTIKVKEVKMELIRLIYLPHLIAARKDNFAVDVRWSPALRPSGTRSLRIHQSTNPVIRPFV